MYLKRLELQGFKTFAQKTVLVFEPDAGNRRGLTAVVGPNGSGKSNVADSLRWVMGEQSLKLLRAKKSEDVIFSGTEKKARAGFAEVSMTLVNDDRQDLDFSEIVITRRLFRDGQSEYEVNKQSVRLTDVVMLLAQCGIGQRTYSVIGQGMVDEVLSSSPSERKEFFDEAAGLRPFQLKRQASMNKLDAARDNLKQTETLLREIGPRLTSLERQVKRLEQRETLEHDLKELETKYFGGMWFQLRQALKAAQGRHNASENLAKSAGEEADKLEGELHNMEKAIPPSEGFRELRAALDRFSEERARLRERQFKLESSREIAKARADIKPWSPLPLSKIIAEIEILHKFQLELVELLENPQADTAKARQLSSKIHDGLAELLGKLQRPAPEPEKQVAEDPAVAAEARQIAEALSDLDKRTREAQFELEQWNKREDQKRSHIFEVQRQLSRKRQEVQQAEHQMSQAAVELARVETRRDAFLQDLRAHRPEHEDGLDGLADTVARDESPEAMLPKITKMRAQLEWIGGIDPEIMKEYQQTKSRYDELSVQTQDLTQAIASLDTIVKELDQTIAERSADSFRRLNAEFEHYFKKLFGGGEAKLVEVFPEPEVNEQGEVVNDPDAASRVGIDIMATPPGKRLKAIALLSGGERALVSIALICSIMATNPSPFVVLDEVDAALDESNSSKFAEIVSTLADRTQFVIVTHNRQTMSSAHILYGVTMGADGVSQLLSVKLQDVLKQK